MRTFVAIELDERCRGRLVRAVEGLRAVADGVRWVKAESLHLTLKFIGEMAEKDLPAAIEGLEAAGAGLPPFAMAVRGLSAFPPRGRPRVIHVGCEEPDGVLMSLQGRVEAGLRDALGIAPEKRRYIAHITLGRVKSRGSCPAVEDLAAAAGSQEFGTVAVDSFVLMRSELLPGGAVYTAMHRFGLVG